MKDVHNPALDAQRSRQTVQAAVRAISSIQSQVAVTTVVAHALHARITITQSV